MEHKTRTKALSWLLSLAMLLSLIPGVSLTAFAAGVSYVDGSGESKTVDATELEAATTNWTDGSWYIVPEGGLIISSRITVNGTVNLILRDGATLTANAGITTTNATLNIYAQSAGTGALTATGSAGCAGIGGGVGGSHVNGGAGGTVRIFGGTVTATGGTAASRYGGGAGIGGGGGGSYGTGGAGGTVNIFGGTVTATGGTAASDDGGGAGIGGGGGGVRSSGGAGGTVSISGGTVTATGGAGAGSGGGAGAGIGGGGKGYSGSDGAVGTLTLGTGVKLYNGTDNSGTVLDGSDSTERSYNGSRPQNMFAEFISVGPDKTALNDAITAAETLYNSIKDNNDYSDIANTLKTAIETAQGVAENDEADQDTIDAATAAITAAKTPAEAALAAAQAKADGVDYIITIPAKLSVKSDGWNPTDGVTAKLGSGDAFNSNKKLTVTATSKNSWALKSDENSIGYKLATASADTKATTSWEFSADEITTAGTTKPMGIIVDDFSAMPAGKYTDTVTFTASVETAKQLHSFTLTGPYSGQSLVVEFYEGDTWNDMAAKYSNLKIIRDWIGFGDDGMISKNDKWVLTTDTVDPNATYTIQ